MTTAVVTERRGVVLDQEGSRGHLEIHLYERGAKTALCGYQPGPHVHKIPWAKGMDDCEICWGIYLKGFWS